MIVGAVLLVGYMCLAVVLAPFKKRDADAKIAFEPLLELRPVIFDNTFGVYVIEFGSASALSDLTAHKLMSLNKLPSGYDLTLILRTGAVTDQSISTLSRMNTTDTIVLDGAGLTDAGIAALEQSLPGVTLSRRTGLDTDHQNRAGGEPSRAPEPGQRDLTDGQSVLPDR